MPALKSDGVYQRYSDFSDVHDLAWTSRTTGLTAEVAAKRLGINVTLVGDLIRHADESLRNNNREGLGLPDPYQGFKNNPYQYGPDVPYEDDEHKFGNKPPRKPRF